MMVRGWAAPMVRFWIFTTEFGTWVLEEARFGFEAILPICCECCQWQVRGKRGRSCESFGDLLLRSRSGRGYYEGY